MFWKGGLGFWEPDLGVESLMFWRLGLGLWKAGLGLEKGGLGCFEMVVPWSWTALVFWMSMGSLTSCGLGWPPDLALGGILADLATQEGLKDWGIVWEGQDDWWLRDWGIGIRRKAKNDLSGQRLRSDWRTGGLGIVWKGQSDWRLAN